MVEVRRGTLRSSACSRGPATRRRRRRRRRQADLKSNNPQLTGGEQRQRTFYFSCFSLCWFATKSLRSLGPLCTFGPGLHPGTLAEIAFICVESLKDLPGEIRGRRFPYA